MADNAPTEIEMNQYKSSVQEAKGCGNDEMRETIQVHEAGLIEGRLEETETGTAKASKHRTCGGCEQPIILVQHDRREVKPACRGRLGPDRWRVSRPGPAAGPTRSEQSCRYQSRATGRVPARRELGLAGGSSLA